MKLSVLSEQGKEAIVAIMEPGQFFGESCLNGDTVRVATSTSLGDSIITSITKPAVRAAPYSPEFSELF